MEHLLILLAFRMLIMLVVKLIEKALVVHVNSLVICLCHGLGKSKTQLLFPLLKLNTLQLEIVVPKF